MTVHTKEGIRLRIRNRIRKKVSGAAERPRLAVFRSQGHIYAQVIDDEAGRIGVRDRAISRLRALRVNA